MISIIVTFAIVKLLSFIVMLSTTIIFFATLIVIELLALITVTCNCSIAMLTIMLPDFQFCIPQLGNNHNYCDNNYDFDSISCAISFILNTIIVRWQLQHKTTKAFLY